MRATRREFLISSAAVVAAPTIIPASALGKDGHVAPSERVTLGCIGTGGMGTGNLRSFTFEKRTQVVAVCDVDAGHRANALKLAKLGDKAGYNDFRDVTGRDDIDAVMIATPDHWHALITLAAVRSGKDVYCEKPLAASIGESKLVRDEVVKHKRVLQCGTWRRSRRNCRFVCELVRNGRIGELKEIVCGVPGTFAIRGGFTGLEEPTAVPKGLDWEMWQAPVPARPFTPGRCHFNFRWVNDYAPGYITDWGAHFLDIAQWGNAADDSGPSAISAERIAYREKGIYDAPEDFRITYTYPNGVKCVMIATDDKAQWGMKFIGTEGWVWTFGQIKSGPHDLRREKIGPNELHLYESKDHHANFIDGVLSRGQVAAPIEVGHRSATICHLGAIAVALDRPLKWDPVAEKFPGDAEANKLVHRPIREPWSLTA